MSSGLYSHTTRGTGTVLTAAIYNADHTNHITNQNPSMTGAYSDNVTQMQLTTDPGGIGTESLAPSLAGELERLRFQLKAITGGAQWYAPPSPSLAGLGTAITTQKLTVSKDVNFTGDLTPTQITGNQNDYAPTGHASAFRFLINSSAAFNITGLAGGVAGRVVAITNTGTFTITLKEQDAGSSAANRFLNSGDVALAANQTLWLQYDGGTTNRWRTSRFAELVNKTIVGNLTVGGDISSVVNVKTTGYLEVSEIASPASPAADKGRIYVKDVGGVTLPFMKDSAGNESALIGAMQLLNSGTVASAASLDISLVGFISTYRRFKIVLDRLVPATDDVRVFARLSTDGGSTWISTASYGQGGNIVSSSVTGGNTGSLGNTSILLTPFVGAGDKVSNTASEGGVSLEFTIGDCSNTGVWPHFDWVGGHVGAGGGTWGSHMHGTLASTQDIDAVQFFCESGNIASGKWGLFGIL